MSAVQLTLHSFHAVDAQTVKQTIAESKIMQEAAIDMNGFTVYHGTRDGLPIVIVENANTGPDALSSIWYETN